MNRWPQGDGGVLSALTRKMGHHSCKDLSLCPAQSHYTLLFPTEVAEWNGEMVQTTRGGEPC